MVAYEEGKAVAVGQRAQLAQQKAPGSVIYGYIILVFVVITPHSPLCAMFFLTPNSMCFSIFGVF